MGSISYPLLKQQVLSVESVHANSLKRNTIGGRGRDRTGGPLLAKQQPIYDVIGSSSFVLRLVPRFYLVFGRFWTQVGPKFYGRPC